MIIGYDVETEFWRGMNFSIVTPIGDDERIYMSHEFVVDLEKRQVQEYGTRLKYDVDTQKGYQLDDNGRRISIASYGAFGDCLVNAYKAATSWEKNAQRAWDAWQA